MLVDFGSPIVRWVGIKIIWKKVEHGSLHTSEMKLLHQQLIGEKWILRVKVELDAAISQKEMRSKSTILSNNIL